MIMQRNADAFAKWLAVNQPEIFEGLLRAAVKREIPEKSALSGISDVLSSFGTSFGNAVKSVGSFLSSDDGMKTVGTLGALYLQTQAQRDALKLQTATIKAGYPPQPVTNVGVDTNSAVPVYAPTGQPLTPQLTAALTPRKSIFEEYAPAAMFFAVALGFLWAVRPKR